MQGIEAERHAKRERISIAIARQPRDQAVNLGFLCTGSFLATLLVFCSTAIYVFCFFPFESRKCLVVPCPACFFLWSGTNQLLMTWLCTCLMVTTFLGETGACGCLLSWPELYHIFLYNVKGFSLAIVIPT